MHSYETGGLKDKYIISKKDGTPIDEGAYYFPLRLDADPHARLAARIYAHSVKEDNPVLATDILMKLWEIKQTKKIRDNEC